VTCEIHTTDGVYFVGYALIDPALKKEECCMKKNRMKDQEQEGKPRRLGLNRETILVLNDPALELAQGGGSDTINSDSTRPTECP
jgi:hypothetical protein